MAIFRSNPAGQVLLKAMADHLGVSVPALRAANRTPRIAHARWQVMYVLRQVGEYSYPEIGLLLTKDHTTVMFGCQKIAEGLAIDSVLRSEVEMLLSIARKAFGKIVPMPTKPTEDGTPSKPPLMLLLEMERDECLRDAQNSHRRAMLLDAAITRLMGKEEQLVTVNVDRADEVIS